MRSSSCVCAACALWVASSLVASAQTFKTLVDFNRHDGSQPDLMTLIQGRDGKLWGTTDSGGAILLGTAFRVAPDGTLSKILSFDSTHGSQPVTGLVLGRDNHFFGVTQLGGTNNDGIVFKLSPTGALTVLFNFDGAHGSLPVGALTLGTDGNFYGTTAEGGTSTNCSGGCGTVFKIASGGVVTTLYNFDSTHGAGPYAVLVQGTDGDFYGTTYAGGTSIINCLTPGCGTVFRITPTGTLTVLHSFGFSDGENPGAGLVEETDGSFYGTTRYGGSANCLGGCGTVFKITRGGTLTTLYSFSGGADGSNPYAPLVEGTDGNLYGTAGAGSSSSCAGGCGTIFQITPSGVLTTLHAFGGPDGATPVDGLVQHTSGLFYGTTASGGSSNCRGGCGTVFSLDMGLKPFIKTTTTLGKVGSRVQILGTGLTGATSVTFNGTPATFSVQGDGFMVATVPTGATTGPVHVITPTGTLTSNVNFRVAP